MGISLENLYLDIETLRVWPKTVNQQILSLVIADTTAAPALYIVGQ